MACRIHHVVIEALEELAKGWKLGRRFIVLLKQMNMGHMAILLEYTPSHLLSI